MIDSSTSPDLADPASDGITVASALEAILITSDRPVPIARAAESMSVSGVPADTGAVEQAVSLLNESYADTGRSFRIERVAGGLRLMVLPDLAGVLTAFHSARASAKLSRAAIETLAVIAYRQPVTRAEVEAIRGVAAGDVLRSLIDRRLVTIAGRAEELGRPMLYGTTAEFLRMFGLSRLSDLPAAESFAAPVGGASE
jgi:segregation and condensation protein B